MSDARGPSRRAVLLGGAGVVVSGALAAGAVAGCSTPPAPPPPPAPDPDDALRAVAATRERDLLLAYDAALAADPGLTPTLTPVRAHHEEHLAALVASAPLPSGRPPPTPAPAPPPTPPATPTPAASAVGPVSLAALVAAERTAAARHADDAANARDRGLAALLAMLSASEQSHPVALS